MSKSPDALYSTNTQLRSFIFHTFGLFFHLFLFCDLVIVKDGGLRGGEWSVVFLSYLQKTQVCIYVSLFKNAECFLMTKNFNILRKNKART